MVSSNGYLSICTDMLQLIFSKSYKKGISYCEGGWMVGEIGMTDSLKRNRFVNKEVCWGNGWQI
jgi:hypothetical protein